MFIHLVGKVFYNLFADLKMPMDKWTIIDLITCFFNLVCFNVIGEITPEQIQDPAQKQVLDYYVIVVVIVGWLRFFSYFLIIKFISKLLMTLARMLTDTLSFLFITVCYMLVSSTVFMMLFQSASQEAVAAGQEEVINLDSYLWSMRSMFDAMMGNYTFEVPENYIVSFSILMCVHVFCAAIFLLNYLIAILATVYEMMHDYGEFSFKSNQYMFIEKYSIAMDDKTGYSQLVIYPPPLNIFCIFIAPFILSKNNMLKIADGYQRFIYWVENFFFSIAFLSYEFFFLPWIYLKIFYNIFRLANWGNVMQIFFMWLVCGPIYLLTKITMDYVYFIKILCDYDMEMVLKSEKDAEDYKQDKIVMFNEIIEVMKGIKQMVETDYKKEIEKKRKKMRKSMIVDDDDLEGKIDFTIAKSKLIKAWKKHRPESETNSRDEEGGPGVQNSGSEQFMAKVLMGFKNRKKNDLGPNEDYDNQIRDLLKRRGSEDLNESVADSIDEKQIPPEEISLIEDFVDKFIFT